MDDLENLFTAGERAQIAAYDADQPDDQKIRDLHGLWQYLSRRDGNRLATLATVLYTDEQDLVTRLYESVVRESRDRGGHRVLRPWQWLRREWIAAIPVVVLVAVLLLALNLAFVSRASWLRTTVVATHELPQGSVITMGDVREVRTALASGALASKQNAIGAVTSSHIARGQPLRPSMLMREQITAERDLPQGTIVTRDAIKPAWTPYQIDAALQVATIVGQPAPVAIRAGDVIRLTPTPSSAHHATQTMPAPTPALTPSSTQLLTLSVPTGVVDPGLSGGEQIALLFVPRDRKDTSLQPTTVSGVLLRAVDRRSDGVSLLLELTPAQLEQMKLLLNAADVYIVEPP